MLLPGGLLSRPAGHGCSRMDENKKDGHLMLFLAHSDLTCSVLGKGDFAVLWGWLWVLEN
jgi:hypothetical protein